MKLSSTRSVWFRASMMKRARRFAIAPWMRSRWAWHTRLKRVRKPTTTDLSKRICGQESVVRVRVTARWSEVPNKSCRKSRVIVKWAFARSFSLSIRICKKANTFRVWFCRIFLQPSSRSSKVVFRLQRSIRHWATARVCESHTSSTRC